MSIEFIYEPEFPHDDVSADSEKLSALHSVAETFSRRFLFSEYEFDDYFIESLELLGIDSVDASLEFDGVLIKINNAIREIEDLASQLAHWRAEKKIGHEVPVFKNDSMSLGPLAETIDLLRADYYVYSGYIECTNSKWASLREPIKLFNDVAMRFFHNEWCYLFGSGMRRAAAAFFAYKALCEKYGVEKIDEANGNSPFRIECTRVHWLFCLGVNDFVSELDEKYDTFEMLKLAPRQKGWLPSNWKVGPTTLSDGKRLMSNHQLVCALLGVAKGLFQKHGIEAMRKMPWMAMFLTYNSACWLTIHIYQTLPSLVGKVTMSLPLTDYIRKEGRELIDDMVNLFRFAQLDMFALESDTRNFMGHCIYELFAALEEVPRIAILGDNNELIDAIYNFKSIVNMFFGYFEHRNEWSQGKAVACAEAYKRAGSKAVEALSKACYRLEMMTARHGIAKVNSEDRPKSRKPRVVDGANVDTVRIVQELIEQVANKFQGSPIPTIVHGFDAEGAKELRREVKSVLSNSRHRGLRRSKRGVGGRGPKTEFMKRQLTCFKRFLREVRYTGDESRLYAHANRCWIENKAKWDKAKTAEGQSKGYSCPKVLADAYKNHFCLVNDI